MRFLDDVGKRAHKMWDGEEATYGANRIIQSKTESDMIFDQVENIGRYFGLSEAADVALRAAQAFLKDAAEGRHEFDRGVFCNVSTYMPKLVSEAVFETHNRYADLQLILSGTETFAVQPLVGAQTVLPYDAQRDIALYKLPPDAEAPAFLSAKSGWFYLVFAGEPHAPGLSYAPSTVKKAVFKIPV